MDDDTQDKLIDLYTQYGDQLTQPRLRCGASTATTTSATSATSDGR